jgi:2-methylfumaryl-CoA hydratase
MPIDTGQTMIYASNGRFFEDFSLGQTLVHATPRTVTQGDVALYLALYGDRRAVHCSAVFARSLGYPDMPVDDLLVFHLVFGKSVPDISLNAVANLGYAEGRFLAPVFVGDTIRSVSVIIGRKQNAKGGTGIVHLRTRGINQRDETVLDYARWVMVNKRDPAASAGPEAVPELAERVDPLTLGHAVPRFSAAAWDDAASGSPVRLDDYAIGARIDHPAGMTVEEAEHQLATRLYQNTAKVHFDARLQASSRFGKRLIYGGHVISLARALSFDGLANAFHIAGINGGRHVAPLFAGDTVYAASETLEKAELSGRPEIGLLRLRLIAAKNEPVPPGPVRGADGAYHHAIILDFDYWAVVPR